MADEIYANGREVIGKAADGKTIAAFPDVCFTPPESPAPGVPLPYPNTGRASDTTSGSRTVQIRGKEVMLRDQSCFKQSTGDEAGCAAKKGIVTGTNRGKVYFTSWSMDVKIEGQNVVRHLDLTTHNHASQPGNTPPTPHQASAAKSNKAKPCIHQWWLAKPAQQYTAEQKKARLRHSDEPGNQFEAAAADHNGITDGDDMSGENPVSKLFARCKNCPKYFELDHVTRNDDGTLESIVECKSAGADIKGAQALARLDIASQLGCRAVYKVPTGESGEKAARFLIGKGWNPSSIIRI